MTDPARSYTLIVAERPWWPEGSPDTAASRGSAAPCDQNPVLAIGVFDGVHIGHHSLLEAAAGEAARAGAPLWVLTFWPHPEAVLGPPRRDRYLLTTLEDKVRLLKAAGAARVLVLAFDRRAAAVSAEEFVRGVLAEGVAPASVVVGFNFNFGQGGLGTPALLGDLCRSLGIAVRVHPAVRLAGDVVSSTSIRAALAAGDVDRAGLMLGRPVSLLGTVEPGAGRGRKLGFPTANISLTADVMYPATGVYICSVARGEAAGDPRGIEAQPAVANIGLSPTFSADGPAGPAAVRLEAHVLDGTAPAYGDTARVFFHRRLRPEVRFAGPAELTAQIASDREKALAFFGLPASRGA